jgi:hypothetical protein
LSFGRHAEAGGGAEPEPGNFPALDDPGISEKVIGLRKSPEFTLKKSISA